MDREKVIKGLECCIGQFPGEDYCKTCAYQPYRFGKCKADAITDALSLLKEQEPKLVRIDEDSVHCPSCGNELFTFPQQKFCDECGQAVKWE